MQKLRHGSVTAFVSCWVRVGHMNPMVTERCLQTLVFLLTCLLQNVGFLARRSQGQGVFVESRNVRLCRQQVSLLGATFVGAEKSHSRVLLADDSRPSLSKGSQHVMVSGLLVKGWGSIILFMWVVVKVMVPFWIPIIVQHLMFRVPKKGPEF